MRCCGYAVAAIFGGIAQLVERVVRNDEAWGSNPHTSTISLCEIQLASLDENAVRLVGRDRARFQSRPSLITCGQRPIYPPSIGPIQLERVQEVSDVSADLTRCSGE